MFDMNYRIVTERDGAVIVDTKEETKNFRFLPLISISVEASVSNLTDFATVVLSGFLMNQKIGLEKYFKTGDKIKIYFGYGSVLNNEFEGYIDKCTYNGQDFIINCIDELFIFKKSVKDKEFKNVSLLKIMQYLASEVNSEIKIVTDVDLTYDKYVIHEATAFDVLKKIAEDTKFNIFFLGNKNELHVHGAFIEKFGEVIYSMQQNVEKFDLTYISKEDKKLKVVIEGTDINGKSFRLEKGNATDNNDIITLKPSGINIEQAKKLLESTYNNRFRDRYDGSLTGWLIPYCRPGFTAKIKDLDFEERISFYYVDSVVSEFSESGGKRTVKLGFRVG